MKDIPHSYPAYKPSGVLWLGEVPGMHETLRVIVEEAILHFGRALLRS